MIKKSALLLLIASGLLFFNGCGTTKDKKASPVKAELADAPKWVLHPEFKGRLAAVGSAKMSKAGLQFTRTNALANGRDELARQMNLKVKNLVKNFTQSTGIGDDETVDKVTSNVSKQVVNETLVGSKQQDLWISPANELYILVVADPDAAAEAVKQSIQSSYKNDNALWQQFQSKKAHEDLDREIEKEFGAFKGE